MLGFSGPSRWPRSASLGRSSEAKLWGLDEDDEEAGIDQATRVGESGAHRGAGHVGRFERDRRDGSPVHALRRVTLRQALRCPRLLELPSQRQRLLLERRDLATLVAKCQYNASVYTVSRARFGVDSRVLRLRSGPPVREQFSLGAGDSIEARVEGELEAESVDGKNRRK